MAVTADKPAPYAPASAILEIMSRFRSRGLPIPITPEVLGRVGISSSLVPRSHYALEVLGLVDDDGNPTEAFERLRKSTEGDYQQMMYLWLTEAYADIFSFVDPSRDGETAIRDAFRNYKPVGQQNRMVSLFQGLCVAAGAMPAAARVRLVSATPRPVKSVARVRDKKDPTAVALQAIQEALNIGEMASARTPISGHVMASMPEPSYRTFSRSLPPALAGLMDSLPHDGWTKKSRDQFMKSFEAVLDFSIPIRDDPETKEDDHNVTVLNRSS